MKAGLLPILVITLTGAAWGLSMPLVRISVSTGHDPFGLVAWQSILSAVFLAIFLLLRGRPVSIRFRHWRLFLFIALAGNILPSSIWFITASHLPAGVLAVVISLVPMFALPIALFLRLERFQWKRVIGVMCGAIAIGLLIGPKTSLPDPTKAAFVLLALVAPLCYGIEGNGLAKIGLGGLDPIEAVFGASVLGALILVPIVLAAGVWVDLFQPWGAAEFAILGSGLVSTPAYAAYVWLVGRAGSVFASQVSYLVTGFGLFWSIILLGESYSDWIWLAIVTMMVGLFLVRPNPVKPLAQQIR